MQLSQHSAVYLKMSFAVFLSCFLLAITMASPVDAQYYVKPKTSEQNNQTKPKPQLPTPFITNRTVAPIVPSRPAPELPRQAPPQQQRPMPNQAVQDPGLLLLQNTIQARQDFQKNSACTPEQKEIFRAHFARQDLHHNLLNKEEQTTEDLKTIQKFNDDIQKMQDSPNRDSINKLMAACMLHLQAEQP